MPTKTSRRAPPASTISTAVLGSSLALLAAGGCGTDAPRPSASPQPEAREATPALPPSVTMPVPSAAAQAPGAGPFGDIMHDHFALASQVRDAVVRGRLEQAEAPLIWLGQHGAAERMPPNWRPGVERMQSAARAAGDAATLTSAGRAIARVAAECGACHAELKRGPTFEPSAVNDLRTPSRRSVLRERMHEQLWAIDRLWEGLIAPSEEAWREGCKSLRAPGSHPNVSAAQRAGLERVRALAGAAAAAGSPAERATAYGDVLGACGSCHASSGVDPGAFEVLQQP